MINLTNQNNEIAEQNTNELAVTNQKQQYEITQNADGKFKRKAIYKQFASLTPVTTEQKLAFMNMLDGDDENTLPLGEHLDQEILISDVVTNPYDSVDEDTGEITAGVLTYLITPDNKVYVTSSKTVYFTLMNKIFLVFGKPHYDEGMEVVVKAVKKKGLKHQFTDLKAIRQNGLAE